MLSLNILKYQYGSSGCARQVCLFSQQYSPVIGLGPCDARFHTLNLKNVHYFQANCANFASINFNFGYQIIISHTNSKNRA